MKAIQFINLSEGVKISKSFSLKKVNEEWSQAKSKEDSCCISGSFQEIRLEVWRAHTIMNDFTVRDDDRKETVLNLNNAIGMKNTLKSFPGIFAMSLNPDEDHFKTDHPKYPDLLTRIFGINCELKNYTPAESIYLFAKLLDKYFGQIAYVEKGVLKIIGNTEFNSGPRSLELLISLCKGIKRNIFTQDNLPSENRIRELKEHFPNGLYNLPKYRADERKLVKIIYNVPVHE